MGTAVRMLGYAVAFVIVIGIALVVLDANEGARLVSLWLDAGRFLTDPFGRIFDLQRGKEHEQIAINWGIAAVVYVVVASVLGRLLDRAGRVRAR
jgi:drug/metabolite transporter (DMT)-like permease